MTRILELEIQFLSFPEWKTVALTFFLLIMNQAEFYLITKQEEI